MGFDFGGLIDSGASCTILGEEKLNFKSNHTKIATRIADSTGTSHITACSVDLAYHVKDKAEVLTTFVIPFLTKWDGSNQ